MPSENVTIRYSQMSPVEGDVLANDLILVAQPDPTNLKTGYNVFKTNVSNLTEYFKSIVRVEGLPTLIKTNGGVVGDGSKNSLAIDELFTDTFSIRHDNLNLSWVGDRSKVSLPITPSFFPVFIINEDIPVQLNGALGVIPKQTYDLNGISGGNPANRKFYLYAIEISKQVRLEVSVNPIYENLNRTLFAVITTNANSIVSIEGIPFSRLGLYRLADLPKGSSVAFNKGPFASYVDRFWLTRWYGGSTNWDDYFIPETTIEGSTYQVMTLAPGATLQMMMHAPGGGGGGARYTGGNASPEMNGKSADNSFIALNGATFLQFIPVASGGTEGWWGNGSHYDNGAPGGGGDVARVTNAPQGIIINNIQMGRGGDGWGGWTKRRGGGVRAGLINIPSNVPTLAGYGHGGDGAPGLGDEGWSYGGGGGAGASAFIELINVSTKPLSVIVYIGKAGAGGKSSRNGADGKNGVVWFRQIPK